MFKKIISIILVILWMSLIFSLSSLNGTESNKKSVGGIKNTIKTVVNTTNKVGITKKSKKQEKEINKISKALNFPVRKCMHFTEYLILTCLLYNMFYTFGLRNKKLFILSMLLCMLYASSDEFHQSFTGRTSHISDVLIDSSGGLTFLLIKYLRNRTKK